MLVWRLGRGDRRPGYGRAARVGDVAEQRAGDGLGACQRRHRQQSREHGRHPADEKPASLVAHLRSSPFKKAKVSPHVRGPLGRCDGGSCYLGGWLLVSGGSRLGCSAVS